MKSGIEDQTLMKVLISIFVLFVVLYFYKLGSVGLIDVDEPRYAEAGREMLETGNWVVPYFNYNVRFDKPILFYWLESLSMKVFGVNEFSARFPSLISSFICASFVFYFVHKLYGIRSALIATIVLLSSFEYVALSRFSITDMTVTCFITCSLICFFLGYAKLTASHRFYKQQVTKFSHWYILAFIFEALGVLTKGPFVVLITALIIFPFFWWIRKLDFFLKNLSFWVGFIVFLILVFPWYIAVHFATSGEFTKTFFGLHNILRYTSVVSGHKGSIFYFVPVVFIGFLPWTFFLPQAINCIVNKGLKSLLQDVKNQLPWFCLWWFLVIIFFFSFSKTKLLTYILPLFPALSIIIALWIDKLLCREIETRGLTIGIGVFFLFVVILISFCFFKVDLLMPSEIKNSKLDFLIILFAFLMLVGISMAWASSRTDIGLTVSILATTFLLLYFGSVEFLLPRIDRVSQYLLRTFATHLPKNVELSTYQIIRPSLTFYGKRQISKIDSIEKIQEKLLGRNKFAFVAKKSTLKENMLDFDVANANAYLLGNDNRYVIYGNYPINR